MEDVVYKLEAPLYNKPCSESGASSRCKCEDIAGEAIWVDLVSGNENEVRTYCIGWGLLTRLGTRRLIGAITVFMALPFSDRADGGNRFSYMDWA